MPFQHPAAVVEQAVALVREGALPRQAARALGVDTSTVYAWLHRLAPETVESPSSRCWRCSEDVVPDLSAYAYLLGLYLGDGWLLRQRRSWSLNVACCDAYPALVAECRAAMVCVLAARTSLVRRPGCHDVKSYSNHWPCLFPQHGPGRKHERPIVLEPWQQQVVEAHPGRLLRGLFHSDGWRGTNVAVHRSDDLVTRYRYTRYEFTNRSDDVRGLCTDALDLLEIPWRPNGPWRVSVNRRAAVAALDQHVGPKA
jgi:hypothetical protein